MSTEAHEQERRRIIDLGKQVGLIGWVSDDYTYFTFDGDESASEKLIALVRAAAPAGGAEPVAQLSTTRYEPEQDAAAWIRLVRTGRTFAGVEEYDEQVVNSSVRPAGDGWAPLYAAPTAQPQPQPEPSQEFNRGWDAAIEANRLPNGAERRQDHDWRPRELQEKHGEVTLPLAEFKRLVAAQPEAPAEPSTKPLGYVKFRAAQTLQTDGYCDGHEWLEFCEPGEVGDDKKPAFPVYASPQAATVAQQPAELTDAGRLDWLETKVVNVRDPLLYGSHDLFWASPDQDDPAFPAGPSEIRKRIDTAIKAQGGSR